MAVTLVLNNLTSFEPVLVPVVVLLAVARLFFGRVDRRHMYHPVETLAPCSTVWRGYGDRARFGYPRPRHLVSRLPRPPSYRNKPQLWRVHSRRTWCAVRTSRCSSGRSAVGRISCKSVWARNLSEDRARRDAMAELAAISGEAGRVLFLQGNSCGVAVRS